MKYLQKYCEYIDNTGIKLTTEQFDEDWEPIGPMVRKDLLEHNMVTIENGIIKNRSTD